MPTFRVVVAVGEMELSEFIPAAYFTQPAPGEPFVYFKDDDHKILAAYLVQNVRSVVKSGIENQQAQPN